MLGGIIMTVSLRSPRPQGKSKIVLHCGSPSQCKTIHQLLCGESHCGQCCEGVFSALKDFLHLLYFLHFTMLGENSTVVVEIKHKDGIHSYTPTHKIAWRRITWKSTRLMKHMFPLIRGVDMFSRG